MSDAPETPAPAPSPGLIARLAAAIANSTPVIEPSAEVEAVTAQLTTLQADHQALTDAATAAAEKLEAVQAELVAAQADASGKTTILNAIEAAIPGASKAKDVGEHIKLHAAALAQEQIQASGFKPGEAPGVDAGERGDGTMARAEFNKLSATQQSDFSKSGGKLTD
jgi:hypothetical protein